MGVQVWVYLPEIISPLTQLSQLPFVQIENFLNFLKLTQPLSLVQFLRPLEAFKQKAQVYLWGAVCTYYVLCTMYFTISVC